jgi:hypothetical protein
MRGNKPRTCTTSGPVVASNSNPWQSLDELPSQHNDCDPLERCELAVGAAVSATPDDVGGKIRRQHDLSGCVRRKPHHTARGLVALCNAVEMALDQLEIVSWGWRRHRADLRRINSHHGGVSEARCRPRIGPSVEVAPRSGQPYRPGAALADDRPLKFFRHVAFVLQTLVQLLVLHPPGVGSRRGEDEEALPLFAFVSLLATEADVSSADLNGTDQPLRSGSQISRTLPMNPSGSAHQEMRKTSSTAAACRSARRMPGQPSRGEKRTVPAH